MKLYKLTNANCCTKNNTQWGPSVTHTAALGIPLLCTETVIHAYTSPYLAVLLNPIYGNIQNPLLWEAEGEVVISDLGLKVGCKQLTTLSQIPLPICTSEIRVRFAILCALRVYKESSFVQWANNWLNSANHAKNSKSAACAVIQYVMYAAARIATDDPGDAAACAARAAACAARAARVAANVAERAAAYVAANAAYAAAYAAADAAYAAARAAAIVAANAAAYVDVYVADAAADAAYMFDLKELAEAAFQSLELEPGLINE